MLDFLQITELRIAYNPDFILTSLIHLKHISLDIFCQSIEHLSSTSLVIALDISLNFMELLNLSAVFYHIDCVDGRAPLKSKVSFN